MQSQRLTLSTPTDVITAVAWMLGFHPTNSLTVLSAGGSSPTCRIDFPATGDHLIEAAAHLGATYRQHPGGQAIIVAHTHDTLAAFDAITAVTAMLDGFVEVAQGLIVDGDRWLSTSGGVGSIDPERVWLIEAEMVALGKTPPRPSRDSLAADLAPVDPAPIDTARADVPTDWLTEEWVTARIEEFHRNGVALSHTDATAVLLALTDNEVFDAVMLHHDTTNARAHLTLWHDLTRRGPEDLRGNTASFLALSAWLVGDGALAWVAIDHSNGRSLAKTVSDLLTAALPPSAWHTIRQGMTD